MRSRPGVGKQISSACVFVSERECVRIRETKIGHEQADFKCVCVCVCVCVWVCGCVFISEIKIWRGQAELEQLRGMPARHSVYTRSPAIRSVEDVLQYVYVCALLYTESCMPWLVPSHYKISCTLDVLDTRNVREA